MVAALYEPMARYPGAFAHWLCAAAFMMGDPREVAIVGNPDTADTQALIDVVESRYRPNLLLAVGEDEAAGVVPLLADRPQLDGKATAYVCRRFVCRQPTNDAGVLAEQLEDGQRPANR
jgi:uncharacterized protein YyaL (SSP411 family)